MAVLGEGAKAALFGLRSVGRYVTVHDQWLRVVGVAGPQLSAQTERSAFRSRTGTTSFTFRSGTAMLRLEDNYSSSATRSTASICSSTGVDSVAGAELLLGVLNASHRNTPDFSVIVPAALLAERAARAASSKWSWSRLRLFHVGGRHRDHEHHASQHSRAKRARRRSPGARRTPKRHRAPFPHRDRVISFVEGRSV